MIEDSLYSRALEREMLPKEAQRDVVSANGTFTRLGAFSCTQGHSRMYRVRCEQAKMRRGMWKDVPRLTFGAFAASEDVDAMMPCVSVPPSSSGAVTRSSMARFLLRQLFSIPSSRLECENAE